MRDLDYIPALNEAGEEKFVEAKKLIKGESEEKKENFIKKEVEKLEIKGIDGEKAEKIIRQKVEKNILLPDDEIFDNNNVGIKVEQLLINPEKYNGLYIKDPLEPEKGSCKAIVNSTRLDNINIYSYLHGGFRYEIRPDYSFVLKQATNTYSATPEINEVNVLKIKELCRCARLLDSEIRNIAHILKKNKVINSITSLDNERREVSKIKFPHVTKKGEPLATKENLEVLLAHYNIVLEYDEILKIPKMEINDFEKKTDNRINSIIAEIKNLCVKNNLSNRVVKDYLYAIIDQKSFNPMLDMIKSKKWDGEDRLKHLIDSIFSPDKEKYKKEVITRWLIQCVAAWDRAENSPYQNVLPHFENVLTFVGAQGINKTKFFELLMPREYKEYVGTGIHLDPTNKDSIHLAIGKAITELGELDSTFKKDIAMIKAFLSLSMDKYRRPYAQVESEFYRRTSFCASVNDTEFLVDPTGNRRFWPLLINSIDFKAYQELDKQQLWAQVYETLYLNGEHWWIDFEHNLEVFKMLSENIKNMQYYILLMRLLYK